MKNITIIGSGSFGCALAHSFEKNNNVKIWSFTKEERDSININHECMQIPSIKLNNNTKCYLDYEEALKDSEIVVIVVPSNFVRSTCKDIRQTTVMNIAGISAIMYQSLPLFLAR